jgi:hypothetical protein
MKTIGLDLANVNTIHAFEVAGLGKAPYQFLGVSVKVGPLPLPDGGMVGAPGQPMGSCKFCGTGIKYCFNLLSADGKEFYVGCECIKKSGDRGLLRVVSTFEKEQRRAKNEERKKKKIEQAKNARQEMRELVERHRAALEALPHDFYPGKTKYDHATFCLQHAGLYAVQSWVKMLKEMEGAS